MGFNGTSKAGSTGKNIAPVKYIRGTNAHLDRILDPGVEVWIVNKAKGRRPIVANSAEEALEKYDAMFVQGRQTA